MSSVRFIVSLLLFTAALVGCGDNTPAEPPAASDLIDVEGIERWNVSLLAQVKTQLQEGDLLLRKGTDFSSEQVKDMSKQEKLYSHGGIVVRDSGAWYVYHVEPDFFYIKDKVRKEPVDSFLNRSHNSAFAHARYKLDSTERHLFLSYLEDQYRKKVSFDMSFDLKTDDKMYCSEMIRKGLFKATEGRVSIEIQRLTDKSKYKIIKQYFKVPEKRFANMEIIPIDRLYLNPQCEMIQRYSYRQ